MPHFGVVFLSASPVIGTYGRDHMVVRRGASSASIRESVRQREKSGVSLQPCHRVPPFCQLDTGVGFAMCDNQ